MEITYLLLFILILGIGFLAGTLSQSTNHKLQKQKWENLWYQKDKEVWRLMDEVSYLKRRLTLYENMLNLDMKIIKSIKRRHGEK